MDAKIPAADDLTDTLRRIADALGRARHGKIVAGEGLPCGHQRGAREIRTRPAQADRDPPRGYREPAGADDLAAPGETARHRVLRRSFLRRRRHDLQVAESRAR